MIFVNIKCHIFKKIVFSEIIFAVIGNQLSFKRNLNVDELLQQLKIRILLRKKPLNVLAGVLYHLSSQLFIVLLSWYFQKLTNEITLLLGGVLFRTLWKRDEILRYFGVSSIVLFQSLKNKCFACVQDVSNGSIRYLALWAHIQIYSVVSNFLWILLNNH